MVGDSVADVRELNRMRCLVIVLLTAITALTPVYSAFAEMQATPIIEPTPTPTVEPTATTEPTEAPDMPLGTPDATQDDLDEEISMISPQAVTRDGNFTTCNQTPTDNVVKRGGTIAVDCTYELSSLLSIGILPEMRLTATGLPPGFTATISMVGESFIGGPVTNTVGSEGGTLTWNLGVLLTIDLNETFRVGVRIIIQVPTDAEVGSYSNLGSFEVCARGLVLCRNDASVSVTGITVNLADLVEGTNYDFDCSLSGSPVMLGGTATADCLIDGVTGIGDSELVIHDISSSLDGVSGWDVAFTDTNGSKLEIDPAEPLYRLKLDETFSFKVQMIPTGCTPALPVSVNVLLIPESGPGNVVGNPHTAIKSDLTLTYNVPGVTATAPITGPDDVDNVQYSLTPSVVTEGVSFSFPLHVRGCGPWFSNVQMGPFVKDGDSTHVGPVPEVTGVTHNSSAISPSALANGLPLGNGSDPGNTWLLVSNNSFDLVYTIPANTPVGTYTSTITVTTSDAP